MNLLRQALAREPAQLDIPVRDVADLHAQLVGHAVDLGLVPAEAAEPLITELSRREAESSSAIGAGVAVPHAYLDELEHSAILFCRLQKPLHMGGLDGTATRYVFLLVGPATGGVDHVNSLANIARVMSDDGFRYAIGQAHSARHLVAAFDRFNARERDGAEPPQGDDALTVTGTPFGGVLRDVRRRLPHYLEDFRCGFHPKVLSAVGFMFFACLAPSVTFGGVMAEQTGGAIGAAEMLTATAVCGVVYALFAGQPLIMLGGTGPMLAFTVILYQLCQRWGLPFLPVYAWVGIWSSLLLVILVATDAVAWMRWFTRFTNEIFAGLIALIFIFEACRALLDTFADPSLGHDTALLTLVLALGTLYLGYTLGRFRESRYFSARLRDALADFGPILAIVLMTLVALGLDEVTLTSLAAPDHFGTTSGRPWWVPLTAVPWGVRMGAVLPALLAVVLIYLDQNITARIINATDHNLKKGEGYHLDTLIAALLIGVCSLFGLPWLVAATVRSLNNLRSLSTERRGRIMQVRETRVVPLVVHLLIGLSLIALPLLKTIPMAVLYGLFLMMGITSTRGNQFLDRAKLWFTDPERYPAYHYIGRVPMARIRRFTAIQSGCLVVVWAVKASILGILFPVLIAALVPLRLWVARWFSPRDLTLLDAESRPVLEPREQEAAPPRPHPRPRLRRQRG